MMHSIFEDEMEEQIERLTRRFRPGGYSKEELLQQVHNELADLNLNPAIRARFPFSDCPYVDFVNSGVEAESKAEVQEVLKQAFNSARYRLGGRERKRKSRGRPHEVLAGDAVYELSQTDSPVKWTVEVDDVMSRLDAREREILHLLRSGWSQVAISQELGISEQYVSDIKIAALADLANALRDPLS